MLLWISFAVLTAGVIAIIIRPLVAAGDAAVSPASADLAVYKDQLAEIDADRERGLIGGAEAEAARNEVARRLLAKAGASAASGGDRLKPAVSYPRNAMLAAALTVPVFSVVLYSLYGSPGLPAKPFAMRSGATLEKASVGELLGRVEARLRESPDDGNGWDVIAPVYLRLERYGEAADAFANALRLLGENAQRLGGFAEAVVLANGGIVSEDARRAYEKLSKLDPSKPEPRFWLALAKEQDGKLAEASRDYRALLDSAPADAPWREAVADRLRTLMEQQGASKDEIAKVAGAPPAAPSRGGRGEAPSAEAAAAAEQMSPEQRAEFIKQMVDGLSARLKANGKDLQGWLRLVRAYKVMGRNGEASAALKDARSNFAGDKASLGELEALARSLGLGS